MVVTHMSRTFAYISSSLSVSVSVSVCVFLCFSMPSLSLHLYHLQWVHCSSHHTAGRDSCCTLMACGVAAQEQLEQQQQQQDARARARARARAHVRVRVRGERAHGPSMA